MLIYENSVDKNEKVSIIVGKDNLIQILIQMCIHIMEAETMDEISRVETGALQAQTALSEELYLRFVFFIDAKEKTVQTYKRALKQMFRYFAENGITWPQRHGADRLKSISV